MTPTKKSSKKRCTKGILQNVSPSDPTRFLREMMSLRMPRCGICSGSWYCDDNLSNTVENLSELPSEEKIRELIPLPPCECDSTFISLSSDLVTKICSSSQDYILNEFKDICMMEKGQEERKTKLHDFLLHKFQLNNKEKNQSPQIIQMSQRGMCQTCLEKYIANSEEVLTHDYRSEQQPNVKFSVETKCPSCRKRFSTRGLISIIKKKKEEDEKNKDKEVNKWWEYIKDTIVIVQLIKRLKRIARQYNTVDDDDDDLLLLDDLGDNSSDECFSVDSHEDDSEIKQTNKRRKRNIIEADPGEIKNELLKKDPKFRQEWEDQEFIRNLSKTAEGRLELGLEGSIVDKQEQKKQFEADAQFARNLQENLNNGMAAKATKKIGDTEKNETGEVKNSGKQQQQKLFETDAQFARILQKNINNEVLAAETTKTIHITEKYKKSEVKNSSASRGGSTKRLSNCGGSSKSTKTIPFFFVKKKSNPKQKMDNNVSKQTKDDKTSTIVNMEDIHLTPERRSTYNTNPFTAAMIKKRKAVYLEQTLSPVSSSSDDDIISVDSLSTVDSNQHSNAKSFGVSLSSSSSSSSLLKDDNERSTQQMKENKKVSCTTSSSSANILHNKGISFPASPLHYASAAPSLNERNNSKISKKASVSSSPNDIISVDSSSTMQSNKHSTTEDVWETLSSSSLKDDNKTSAQHGKEDKEVSCTSTSSSAFILHTEDRSFFASPSHYAASAPLLDVQKNSKISKKTSVSPSSSSSSSNNMLSVDSSSKIQSNQYSNTEDVGKSLLSSSLKGDNIVSTRYGKEAKEVSCSSSSLSTSIPHLEPLPESSVNNEEEALSYLEFMGFPRSRCHVALRDAKCDVQLAIRMLISANPDFEDD